MPYADNVEFTVRCSMRARWVPQFLGMLKYMQRLGSWGSSREITFYADGDGDYRPRFEWDAALPEPVEGAEDHPGSGDRRFDAG